MKKDCDVKVNEYFYKYNFTTTYFSSWCISKMPAIGEPTVKKLPPVSLTPANFLDVVCGET